MRALSVFLRVRICKLRKKGVLEYLSSSTRRIRTEQGEMSLLSLKLGRTVVELIILIAN